MAKSIQIDRTKRLGDDPGTGHNRGPPDIPPVLEADPMEEVVIETRESSDGQIRPGVVAADLLKMDTNVVHPLTGPVYVKGARPGDLLEIEYLKITPERHGWTRFVPGLGFLCDLFVAPYLVHWNLESDWATSPSLPGVRIPSSAFMGTAGLAPSHDQLRVWTRREAELADRGGLVFLPDAGSAVPADEPIASHGLRTIPPRENCGNGDIKQI